MDITIRNAKVVTQNEKRDILEADVRIEGNRIAEIAKPGKASKTGHVIEAKGKVLLPGLVNTHTHTMMSLLRGYGDDMKLHEWLEDCVWPVEAEMTPTDARVATELSLLEMIRSGTTCFADMQGFSDGTVPGVTKEAGLRGFLAYGMVDLGDVEKRKSELAGEKEFIKVVKDMKIDRIRPMLGPHAPYTCSKELLEATKDLAKKEEVKIHIHVAETRKEVYDLLKSAKKRPIGYLDALGLLGQQTLMAHAVWLTKAEIGLIAKRGSSISHCPVSNLKLASGGTCPVPELLEAGVTLSLGTDGPASNNNLDIFEEMKMAAIVHKNARWDAQAVPAQACLDMATLGGAKCLGFDGGSIERGGLADLILVDFKRAHLTPVYNPVSHLVYSAHGQDVSTTICDGEILMEDGQVKSLDEAKILEKAQETGLDLVSRATKKTRKL